MQNCSGFCTKLLQYGCLSIHKARFKAVQSLPSDDAQLLRVDGGGTLRGVFPGPLCSADVARFTFTNAVNTEHTAAVSSLDIQI